MKSFNLKKMETTLVDGIAQYQLSTKIKSDGDDWLNLNPLVGAKFFIHFKKEIHCVFCDILIDKTYAQGACYSCSIKLPQCDLCILKPELCHYQKGTCRDPSWGMLNCMVFHYVYLAHTSGLKVGITRAINVPMRFIDQGAVAALPILKVSSRFQSGIFENLFSKELNDKTDWRKMLKGEETAEDVNLAEKRDELFSLFGDDIDRLENEFSSSAISILENEPIIDINYPVIKYPTKINSLSLLKNEVVGGVLLGIKGQYLIFDTGVINIRNHAGFKVELDF